MTEVAPPTVETPPQEPAPPEPTDPTPDSPPQQEQPAEDVAAADTRQQWYHVDPYGPRTSCPAFRSDAHFTGAQVTCPVDGSTSVMRAEQWDAAHPAGV